MGSRSLRKQILKEGTEKIRLKIAQFLLFFGFHIPEDLRSNYINEVYGAALKNYTPQKYSGKIIFYFSGKIESMRKYYSRESKFYWKDINANKKVIFNDNDADHLGIVLEPHIDKWAKKLNHYLEDTNKGSGSKEE